MWPAWGITSSFALEKKLATYTQAKKNVDDVIVQPEKCGNFGPVFLWSDTQACTSTLCICE